MQHATNIMANVINHLQGCRAVEIFAGPGNVRAERWKDRKSRARRGGAKSRSAERDGAWGKAT